MTLKQWIKSERGAGRHWTMAKVAREIGIATANLSKAVNGHVTPSAATVRSIHIMTKGQVSLFDWPEKSAGK